MRDIILYLMAVVLATAAGVLAITQAPGTDQVDNATDQQIAVYHAQADEIRTWTQRLEQ